MRKQDQTLVADVFMMMGQFMANVYFVGADIAKVGFVDVIIENDPMKGIAAINSKHPTAIIGECHPKMRRYFFNKTRLIDVHPVQLELKY